jgi:hypothetical protein
MFTSKNILVLFLLLYKKNMLLLYLFPCLTKKGQLFLWISKIDDIRKLNKNN